MVSKAQDVGAELAPALGPTKVGPYEQTCQTTFSKRSIVDVPRRSGMRSRVVARSFVVALAWLALLPGVARAQSAIVGVVKDASGAVIPGATVEVASPELIEKVRSVVTDERGAYQIRDLRPGVYSVTFSLPGFATIKRDGIELPTDFTSTVNAEMRVGALEETVTVSGASPVVDVQSAAKGQV